MKFILTDSYVPLTISIHQLGSLQLNWFKCDDSNVVIIGNMWEQIVKGFIVQLAKQHSNIQANFQANIIKIFPEGARVLKRQSKAVHTRVRYRQHCDIFIDCDLLP